MFALVALLGAALATPALAITASYEGFDYSTGSLNGNNGGTGDWKDPWSGDSGINVVSPGFTETDASGNELTVSGNRVGKTGNSVLKTVRTLNSVTGSSTETVWASVIIDGDSGNRIHNFSLGDGLFIGQGTKDSSTNRIGISDADGLLQNSSTTPTAQHFLVLRVDFQGGNEDAWLWIDPALDSEPSTASADASSTNVKDFSFDFVQIQVQRPNNTGIDEIRLGSTFAEVTPHTSSAVCGDGTVDAGEQCDDGGVDPGDCCSATCQFEAGGSTCGSAATECSSQDTCDGAGTCQSNDLAASTACGDAGTECTVQDTCNGGGACTDNGFQANGTTCGSAATECSSQDTCDGGGTCQSNDLAASTACGDDGTECIVQDTCDGGGACTDNGFQTAGTSCGGAGDQCNLADSCNGSGTCAVNGPAADGLVCNDGNSGTVNDQCVSGTCAGVAPAVPMSSPPIRMLLVAVLATLGGLAYRRVALRHSAG